MSKFFIFDCNGNNVGNPKGYQTIKGASRWAKTRKMQNLLWSRFELREDKKQNLVWQVIQPGGNSFGEANFEN